MNKVFVTGATGFIGRHLCRRLVDDGFSVVGAYRPPKSPLDLVKGVQAVFFDPSDSVTDWSQCLSGVDTIVHLAAIPNSLSKVSGDTAAELHSINVRVTERLASEALSAGVKRLVYVSTIKVMGEETTIPFSENSFTKVSDPYGISKWKAEQFLRSFAEESGLESVIVRPPLVYGPWVKANFLQLMHMVYRGYPLPLSKIENIRSLIFVGNLVDAICLCCLHPTAAGETYIVSDGTDVSTPELVRMIALAMNKPARLLPIPISMFKIIGNLTGRSEAVRRLSGSLCVDSSKIRSMLGWTPPFTMEQGILKTVEWFKSENG